MQGDCCDWLIVMEYAAWGTTATELEELSVRKSLYGLFLETMKYMDTSIVTATIPIALMPTYVAIFAGWAPSKCRGLIEHEDIMSLQMQRSKSSSRPIGHFVLQTHAHCLSSQYFFRSRAQEYFAAFEALSQWQLHWDSEKTWRGLQSAFESWQLHLHGPLWCSSSTWRQTWKMINCIYWQQHYRIQMIGFLPFSINILRLILLLIVQENNQGDIALHPS